MIVVKKGYENSEVSYDFKGLGLHVKLADASQEELKRLKELGFECVEDKKAKE